LDEGHRERTVSAHYVIDLVVPEPGRCRLEAIQVKHLYHARQCVCGHWSGAEPATAAAETEWRVGLSERHLVGPRLVALICALSLRLRLSRRRVQEFLAQWLGLALSAATINQCLHEAGRALTPVLEEQLLAEVRASDLLHADETSWKEHGQLTWLWVFISATTTVFLIGTRSKAFLHSAIGSVLQGWLMSDGYWAYRDYANRLRCLTHLLRKARGLEESLDGQAQRFGRALREHLEGVMAAVYAAREGPRPSRCASSTPRPSTPSLRCACSTPRRATPRPRRWPASCSTTGTPSGWCSIIPSCRRPTTPPSGPCATGSSPDA
jgi:transposase-like protein